jgi:hypothetical protein
MTEEKKYRINFHNLFKAPPNQFLPSEMVILIVMAGFDRPVGQEEVLKKMEKLGLMGKTEVELAEWIEDWKKKHAPEFLN